MKRSQRLPAARRAEHNQLIRQRDIRCQEALLHFQNGNELIDNGPVLPGQHNMLRLSPAFFRGIYSSHVQTFGPGHPEETVILFAVHVRICSL
ncbi:hypothetical protein D3C73_1198490 [compost metagenome]